MVERKEYLDQLIQWKDEQVIKVVTGIRRCGKSTLLTQYQDWLKGSGISGEQIVSPMWMSAIPEIATMEPMPASVTSTLFNPSNSYNLLIRTFFILSGS